MSKSVAKLLARIERERAAAAMNASVSPRVAFPRDKSINEKDAVYHPQGYGIFFCVHDKHKFGACGACKRTLRDGECIKQRMLAKL